MSELTIKTNNHFIPILNSFDLTEDERKEFDYMDDINEGSFFRYKNLVYSLDQFMRIDKHSPFPDGWHGYHSDSFFSGILVKFSDCNEAVIAATYYS